MSGWSDGLVVQAFLFLSNFSACRPGAALNFGYQSSVKESESEKKLVQKNPGPALAESSILGGKSTHVDLDLKNSAEEWAWVASELLNVNFGTCIVAGLWYVVCGRIPKFCSGICVSGKWVTAKIRLNGLDQI